MTFCSVLFCLSLIPLNKCRWNVHPFPAERCLLLARPFKKMSIFSKPNIFLFSGYCESYHKIVAENNRNLFSCSLRPKVWKQRVFRVMLSPGGRGKSILCLSSFWWLPAPLDLWLHQSNLCLSGHISSSSECVKSLSASLYKDTVIVFRAPSDDLR